MTNTALHIDLPAYEGPLEVLLELAKTQKVDLAEISILALVEQYLAFVEAAKQQNLELAADYLVMAAALAYLKSRLLLPPPEIEEEMMDPAMAAEALAWRLKRLEAMKTAGQSLLDRPQIGMIALPAPSNPWPASRPKLNIPPVLYDFLSAYAAFKRRAEQAVLKVQKPRVFKFEEALERVQRLLNFNSPLGKFAGLFYLPAGEGVEGPADPPFGPWPARCWWV